MTHPYLPILAALPLFLVACATPNQTQPPITTQSEIRIETQASSVYRNGQLELKLASGAYNCEDGVHLQVDREILEQANNRLRISWNGNSYDLQRDPSSSGLPRFEDRHSGLVWIDLPWKGVLLDGKTNRPIANECHSA